jgi:hypothetical protein
MNRLGNLLIVVVVGAFAFLGSEMEVKALPPSVVAYFTSVSPPSPPNTGIPPAALGHVIQGYGGACSPRTIDYLAVYLDGPQGSNSQPFSQSPGGMCKDMYASLPYEYDSYYHLTVVACTNDDDGYDCSWDDAFYQTPPAPPTEGGTPVGSSAYMECTVEPCPYITGIDPIFVFPGSGTLIVHGGNLQNVTTVGVPWTNPWMHADDVQMSVVSASEDQVVVSYTVHEYRSAGGSWLLVADANGWYKTGFFICDPQYSYPDYSPCFH